ncbi:hypothetical protein [Anaeroselena agilis]|uniref:Uncharacterized protein n=1 Tax=Anaeroselena agilis TaxID=3063788 RepID=A0ABU3NZH0_9FIRM|nr:hypothetical protein [Selenomonadales bacterium 4137-cl]
MTEMLNDFMDIEMRIRQTGKTTAICEAARKIGASVICGTESQARMIRQKYGVDAIPIRIAANCTRGSGRTVLYDHFAQFVMVAEAYQENEKMARELDRLRRSELIPGLKFANASIEQQYWHIKSELREVWAELAKEDWPALAEELVDLQTSCETLLYILKCRHGVDPVAAKEKVQQKNRDRGYYEFPECPGPMPDVQFRQEMLCDFTDPVADENRRAAQLPADLQDVLCGDCMYRGGKAGCSPACKNYPKGGGGNGKA